MRTHDSGQLRATELLLQERTLRDLAVSRPRVEEIEKSFTCARWCLRPCGIHLAHDFMPRTHLLSNRCGMLTSAGSGTAGDVAVTGGEDRHAIAGSYIYLRDPRPAKYGPRRITPPAPRPPSTRSRTGGPCDSSRDGALDVDGSRRRPRTTRKSAASPSRTSDARQVELTSYAEIVLAPQAEDDAHSAFARLRPDGAPAVLLATRRRAAEERRIFAAHVARSRSPRSLLFETDRPLSRARTHAATPVTEGVRSRTAPAEILDPIFSLRIRVRIAPGKARIVSTLVVRRARRSISRTSTTTPAPSKGP